MNQRRAIAAAVAAAVPIVLAGTGVAASAAVTVAAAGQVPPGAHDDVYVTSQDHAVSPLRSVLGNDGGTVKTLVRHTSPAHGSLTLTANGKFIYVPNAGFSGTDSFTYTTSDAVKLFSTHLPSLTTIGGVPITGGSYGSSLAPVPGSPNQFYGLTDRGPNVTAPDGVTKIEPLPSFTPAIGRFLLLNGQATLLKSTPLRAGDGTPYNGLVNGAANTGETILDLNGQVMPTSANGYDSEGLVALKDGTFWVSDEYGPFITHFNSHGVASGRLSPFDASLPAELKLRVPNKGMEGLTITPDGSTLVGMMQSALQQSDTTAKPAQVTTLRIVTYSLATHETHEYVYLLTDPKINAGAVSEITALSNTQFVVDERDGKTEPNAYKQLYKIDISGATDIGPQATVPGATYDGAHGGLLIGASQLSLEALVGTANTADATTILTNAGITPVSKARDLDLGGLVSSLDPTGGFFGHDKVEGVATIDGGKTLVISNDSDFGIDGVTNTTPPYQLHAKILPNGKQDDGEFLSVDTTKLGDAPSTATVTILVNPAKVQ
jgi:hypothetical protein